MTNSASIYGTIEAGGMKVTTGAAVTEEGGSGSVGALAPSHGVGGAGSVELTHWEGVRTSQSSSALSPNIYLVNDDGKREALSI